MWLREAASTEQRGRVSTATLRGRPEQWLRIADLYSIREDRKVLRWARAACRVRRMQEQLLAEAWRWGTLAGSPGTLAGFLRK
jgi:hypothetical protein